MCLLVLAQILRRSCEPVSSGWKFDAYELAWYQIFGFHLASSPMRHHSLFRKCNFLRFSDLGANLSEINTLIAR